MLNRFYNSYQKSYNEVLEMHCQGRGICDNCQCEVSVIKKKERNNFFSYICSKCGRVMKIWEIDGSGLPINKYNM